MFMVAMERITAITTTLVNVGVLRCLGGVVSLYIPIAIRIVNGGRMKFTDLETKLTPMGGLAKIA